MIDSQFVPEQFRYLIPLAEKWGINDDGYRAEAIKKASQTDLHELKAAVLPVVDKIYLEWLGDTDQLNTDAKEAYLAFTALVLAAEEA